MISFVFFDVGGVIIKDFAKSNKWQELKFDLGLNGETERTFDDVWNDYENRFLFGVDFEVDRMVDIWRKDHGIPLPKNYSIVSDIASRFEKNESIWPVIRKIHEKVPVGLLTNMYPRMFDILLKSNIMPEVKWDIIIDSSIAGFQKPDPRLFAYAEEKIKVKKEEIFFIDNTEKIIDAANAFGWQTYYYDSADFEKSSRKLDEAFEKLSA